MPYFLEAHSIIITSNFSQNFSRVSSILNKSSEFHRQVYFFTSNYPHSLMFVLQRFFFMRWLPTGTPRIRSSPPPGPLLSTASLIKLHNNGLILYSIKPMPSKICFQNFGALKHLGYKLSTNYWHQIEPHIHPGGAAKMQPF